MQKSYKLHTKTLQKLDTKKITEIDGFESSRLKCAGYTSNFKYK